MLYASNDPDPQGSYSDSREHFMTKKEPFLLDCTPDNNITSDVALLIGSTYSDYESDVHFTPVSMGGTIDMDEEIVEIAQLEKKVSSLTISEDSLRQSITSANTSLTELASEITNAESALEARERLYWLSRH